MRQSGKNRIELKSPSEIGIMREAGHMLQRIVLEAAGAAETGVCTSEIDKLAHARIKEAGAKPAFLGLYGFPRTLCISVNEEVVHGIPGPRKLVEGDIVSIDCGLIHKGFYADTAYTVGVGKVSGQAQKLMSVTREALARAIEQCLPGNRLGDIGQAVQTWVEDNGFFVVKEYGGHGIGRELHEDPRVENFGPARSGRRLKPGLVIAIEPMVNVGTGDTEVLEDDWTVVSQDRSLSAHFEHTVAITEDGCEILTMAD